MNNIVIVMIGIASVGLGMVLAQKFPSLHSCCALPTVQNAAAQTELQAGTVEVGNKHCPVTGNPIGVMGPGVKHLYNGKIYNLCCGMCPRTFDSDPERYAKIAEADAKAAQ